MVFLSFLKDFSIDSPFLILMTTTFNSLPSNVYIFTSGKHIIVRGNSQFFFFVFLVFIFLALHKLLWVIFQTFKILDIFNLVEMVSW